MTAWTIVYQLLFRKFRNSCKRLWAQSIYLKPSNPHDTVSGILQVKPYVHVYCCMCGSPVGMQGHQGDLGRMPAPHVFEGTHQRQQVPQGGGRGSPAEHQHVHQGFTWPQRQHTGHF